MIEKLGLHRYIRFRQRYFYTRSNHLRMRYAFVCGAFAMFVLMQVVGVLSNHSSFFFSSHAEDLQSVQTYEEDKPENVMVLASLNEVDVSDDRSESTVLHGDEISLEGLDVLTVQEKILKIGAGDTISGVLQGAGISGAEAYRAVKAMGVYYDPRTVKPGQAIEVKMEPMEDGYKLTHLDMKLSPSKALSVYMDEHERFKAELIEKQVLMHLKAAKSTIDSSLYASAARAGIPASLIAEMIRLYSYEIDFQRDIRKGDTMEILYETYETEDGEFSHYGNLLYASLNVNKTDIPIYRFERKDRSASYFHADGASLKQLLMKTPVDGARVSSGYGMRIHPILGYSKMHEGVDFAAPSGTPIYAAGDGVIERANRWSTYGNYVRIRHNGTYKTAYAHLRGFAKGIKKGVRVKQGQVIGYVGTTGRSTGPHLHYEVHKNGKKINPKSVKSSNREKLAGQTLKEFKVQISKLDEQYASLSGDGREVAGVSQE